MQNAEFSSKITCSLLLNLSKPSKQVFAKASIGFMSTCWKKSTAVRKWTCLCCVGNVSNFSKLFGVYGVLCCAPDLVPHFMFLRSQNHNTIRMCSHVTSIPDWHFHSHCSQALQTQRLRSNEGSSTYVHALIVHPYKLETESTKLDDIRFLENCLEVLGIFTADITNTSTMHLIFVHISSRPPTSTYLSKGGRSAPIMKGATHWLKIWKNPSNVPIEEIAEFLVEKGIGLKLFGCYRMRWCAEVTSSEDGIKFHISICGLVVM